MRARLRASLRGCPDRVSHGICGVLRECGVVRWTKVGKEQIYALNPKPLNEARDGWLAKFGDVQMESLAALRRAVSKSK